MPGVTGRCRTSGLAPRSAKPQHFQGMVSAVQANDSLNC